jgi:hypothetical protein
MAHNEEAGLPTAGTSWPEPRLRALQVEEIYRFAPTATAFSYFGALVTLGILIASGDIARGAVWFFWATAVTCFRCVCIVSYRRRAGDSDPQAWARLMVAANFLAGVQWGVLGTLLFPQAPGYLQLFTLMVIICFVAGSVTAYSAVKGAHEALSIPATIPTTIYIFFVYDGQHFYAGALALFFCFAIVFYARRLHEFLEGNFRVQLERDDLLTLTSMLNQKLERENRDLAHRVAVRGASVESARDRAERLERSSSAHRCRRSSATRRARWSRAIPRPSASSACRTMSSSAGHCRCFSPFPVPKCSRLRMPRARKPSPSRRAPARG